MDTSLDSKLLDLEAKASKSSFSGRVQFTVTPTEEEEQKQNSYLPALHGKGTDALANMTGSKLEQNAINNTGIVERDGFKLVLGNYDKLKGTLGVSTHKLLSVAISSFTQLNHTGSNARRVNYTQVQIPLKEYARNCGCDIEIHETATEEEAKKEAKRAENALKNARKKINKDLSLLWEASASWKENIRGKQQDFMDVRYISSKGIKNGYICIGFSPEYSGYLIQLPLTQYPVALLAVDERNNNAYAMGLKFAEHFSIDNNQIRNTAQLLKVKTLLSVTSLPGIDNRSVKRKGWKTAIKEPFENALDVLTECGLLEDWVYSHSKGKELTDEEADFKSFEEWTETLVKFTLKDAPDHKARLEARAEEKKKAEAKRKAKKKEK